MSSPAAAPDSPEPVDALVEAGRLVALGELAPGVAHEINNPLFAILGLVEFLLLEAKAGSKAHERLVLIQQSGNEIREIVKTLLDFAREPDEPRRPLPLAEPVAAAVALVRRASAWKGLEIVERYPDGDAPLALGAPGRLEQLVLHLLANAAARMGGEGTVTVEVAGTDGLAETTVSDGGPEIPADVLPHVFEPFGSAAGNRLGLAAARAIARAHGGELTAESRPVAGATFRLRLPLAPSEG